MNNAKKIRVLIADDSSLIRSVLNTTLAQHPMIEVVGTASDGREALRQIKALRPHVVTLDVEMPNMNGIQVLERVVGRAPVAFVMVSTLTQAGARITFEALSKGAFDYVPKPKGGFAGVPEFRDQLLTKVLAAARTRGQKRFITAGANASRQDTSTAPSLPPNLTRGWVVAIGISCGGPQTLMKMMPSFPSDFVPILITQHMPVEFTRSFAQHLDNACALHVKEAENGEVLSPGTAYVAPGNRHMKLVRQGARAVIQLDDGPLVSRHKPSVDVLFSSVAQTFGRRAIGVIMTGMGKDGAVALGEMRSAGAWTIAQDEATSLVFGMPKEAIARDSVDHVVALPRIPIAISKLMQRGEKKEDLAKRV